MAATMSSSVITKSGQSICAIAKPVDLWTSSRRCPQGPQAQRQNHVEFRAERATSWCQICLRTAVRYVPGPYNSGAPARQSMGGVSASVCADHEVVEGANEINVQRKFTGETVRQ